MPANTINNTIRDAMLSRGLVTPERLRARGVPDPYRVSIIPP
jgi:hypothetical protein